MSPSYISMLESGARIPTSESLRAIAANIGISVTDLVGETAGQRAGAPDDDEGLLDRLLGQAAFVSGDMARAQTLSEQAFTGAVKSGSPTRIIESGVQLHRVLERLGEISRRLEITEVIQRTALESGLTDVHVSATIDRASASRDHGSLLDARHCIEGAARLLPTTSLAGSAEEVRMLGVQISIDCELRNYDAAAEAIPRMIALAQSLDNAHILGRARWAAAVASARIGRKDDSLRFLDAANTLLSSTTSVSDNLRFSHAAGSILLDVGGPLDEAREWLDEARAAQRMLRLDVESRVDILEARVLLAEQRPLDAVRLCQEILGRGRELPGTEQIRVLRTYAEAAESAGETVDAMRQWRTLAQAAEKDGALDVAVEAWKRLDDLRTVD